MNIIFEHPRLLPAILVATLLAAQIYPAFNPTFKQVLGISIVFLQLLLGFCVGAILLILLPNNIEIFFSRVSHQILDIRIDWILGFIPKPSFTDIVWTTYVFVYAALASFLSYFCFIFLSIPLLYQQMKSENKKRPKRSVGMNSLSN